MRPELVGRAAQQAQLAGWLTARLTGAAEPAFFISGEAGIGKTALVLATLPVGATVLRAAAVPWHPTPYGLLTRLVPGVAGTDPATVRAALLAAGTPLVLFLDDLHWSDEATLELLPPLVDALAGDPVAVLGAYRGDELPRGHLLRRVRTQLRHRRQLTELSLGPLDPAAVPALIAAVLGGVPDAALTDAVAERADGVPFFVEEMLAALRAAGWLVTDGDRIALAAGRDLPLPETVRDAVLLRAAGLSAPARAALDVAAVFGPEFDTGTVADLLDAAWPDDLDQSGLIAAGSPVPGAGSGGARRFRHALVQESVYAEVPWSRRRALHLAVAERLAAASGAPLAVARHLLAAHAPERARPALVTAAGEYLRAGAHRDAARLLGTALESWPPGQDEAARLAVVERLARCAELSGDHPTAVTNLRELVDRVAPAGPPIPDTTAANRAGLLRRLAVQYEVLGHWPLALSARESAAGWFSAAGLPGESAAEQLAIAAHLRSAASFRAALDVLDSARDSAESAGRTDLLCRIGGLRGNVLARAGRAAEGVPAVRAALDLALAHHLTGPAAEIYQRLADSLEHAGDYRAASRAYDSAYEFCDTHAQDATGQLCRACATVVMFQSGRWDRALAASGAVLAQSAATPHARAVASGVTGLVYAMRGRAAAARSALLDAQATARRVDLVAMELLSAWGLALLDEAGGRAARAADSYRFVVRRCRETEERHYCVPVLQFAAARFAADGADSDLGAATELLADAAATTGQPEARAAFAYALGESALAQAGPDQALPHLYRALDLLDGLDLPIADTLVRQRTAVALAGTSPRVREQATTLLREAQRTAHRLRARVLLDPIGAHLDRIAVPRADPDAPRPTPAAGEAPLSPREEQVLRLVGEGLTSREIGQRLFLSVRTVEMHVRNGVAKLGCRTRAAAVRRLTAADPS